MSGRAVGKVHYVQSDLRDVTQVLELCRQADRLFPEGIDILVNNAGKTFEFPAGYIDGNFENNVYAL